MAGRRWDCRSDAPDIALTGLAMSLDGLVLLVVGGVDAVDEVLLALG